jgi:hypothetical protein
MSALSLRRSGALLSDGSDRPTRSLSIRPSRCLFPQRRGGGESVSAEATGALPGEEGQTASSRRPYQMVDGLSEAAGTQ